MNTAINFNRTSANALILVPTRRKGKPSNVSNIVQPVRDVILTETVRASALPLEPPVGFVYTASFLDGTKRELFVEVNDRGQQYFDTAIFLKDGRKGNLQQEIWDLEIRDIYDRPSKLLVDHMKKDALARGGAIAPSFN